MAEMVTTCPRCRAKDMTFDVLNAHVFRKSHGWQLWYELFSVCRMCNRSTVFIVYDDPNADYKYTHKHGLLNVGVALNQFVGYEGYVSLKDTATVAPPDHIPESIDRVFREGATCYAVQCYNAAGTMFRLCIDLTTRGMLPDPSADEPPARVRRNLGLRLPWLFANGRLPEDLRGLSDCVREDGNDGAHAGTLEKADAEDLMDFTKLLLERIYTEPKRVELAAERRDERRRPADQE